MKGASGLDAVIAQVDKQYGKNTIMQASEAKALVLKRVPFGIPAIDLITSGVPRARIIKIQGEPSTGKSLVALSAVREFQRRCRYCNQEMDKLDRFTGEVVEGTCSCAELEPMRVLWLDVEGTWDNDWARKQDVDTSNVYVIRPSYTEQGLDVADLMMRSKECDLIVVDSVAAMAPSVEIEESSENWQMGVQARLVNKAMRKWTSAMNSCGLEDLVGCPTVILINQMRATMAGRGKKTSTPGGKGQDFHASFILELKTGKKKTQKTGFKDVWGEAEEEVIGKTIIATVEKNKIAPPHRSMAFDFYFKDVPDENKRAGEHDLFGQVFALGLRYGYIQQAGSWFSLAESIAPGKDRLGQGEKKAVAALENMPELCHDIWEHACRDKLGFVL